MFIWFAVLSIVGVFLVFRDSAMDYRLVALGALLPDPIDWLIVRKSGPMHSVVIAVAILTVTMLATIGRRSLRRQLLAIPIGMFGHLALDGAWSETARFWWPLTGTSHASQLPLVSRGLLIDLAMEVVGLGVAAWAYRRFQLSNAAYRKLFATTGRISRSVR